MIITYGDIILQFRKEHEELCHLVDDCRPSDEIFGVPSEPYTIIIWLKDGRRLLYKYDGNNSELKELETTN